MVAAGPLACGYPTGCWTSTIIQDLIYRQFGVMYNAHYVCQLLRNLGFSFQKAKFVSDHLDCEQRRKWMDEEWPRIHELARHKRALLLFVDEASFPQWGSLSYTWAPRGEQPVVMTSGQRKGYKVFGAIDYFTGQLFHRGIPGRFNSETYAHFLTSILKQTNQPIVLIHDGAKYHTSKATKEFIDQHSDRLTVYRLPSYSPDYNPIEYLWKNVKKRSTHHRYFPEFDMLIETVEDGLAYYAEHPETVLCLMGRYCAEEMTA